QLPDLAVGSRHLEEAPCRTVAAAAPFLLVDLLPVDLQAALTERDDQLPGPGVIGGRGPVVAALRARASLDPLSELLLHDVEPVLRPAGLLVERAPDVLKQCLLVAEILARLPIELPQDAVLADGEQQVLVAIVHEHALEDDVEVQRFGGRV